jgi:uncharacterized membrane protein
LIAFVVALSALFNLIYFALGLWIVAAFLCLATAGLVTMLLFFQSGQKRCEEVTVQNGFIRVAKYRKGVLASDRSIAQTGFTIECERDVDFGLQRICLRSETANIEVARDLSPAERSEFLNALRFALAQQGQHPRVSTILAASGP